VLQAKVKHIDSGTTSFTTVHLDESGKALITKGWQVLEIYTDNDDYQIAYNAAQDAKEAKNE